MYVGLTRHRSDARVVVERNRLDAICRQRQADPCLPASATVMLERLFAKNATIKRYHYESDEQLRTHLQLLVYAYNHARRLKTLRGLTSCEHVLQVWTKEPKRSRLDPSHHISGPYTYER